MAEQTGGTAALCTHHCWTVHYSLSLSLPVGGITVALDWDGSPEAANLQPPGGFLCGGKSRSVGARSQTSFGDVVFCHVVSLRRSRLELEACLRTCFTFSSLMGNFSTRLNANYYHLAPIVGYPALLVQTRG